MRAIDPNRLDLAAEFRERPLGPHSAELEDLLRILRWAPAQDRYISVQPETDGPWYLARTLGPKGTSLDVYTQRPYESAADAAWAVFAKRWESHTGVPLRLDEADEDPAGSAPVKSETLIRERPLGYADTFSVERGGAVEFKVSSPFADNFHAEIHQIGRAHV